GAGGPRAALRDARAPVRLACPSSRRRPGQRPSRARARPRGRPQAEASRARRHDRPSPTGAEVPLDGREVARLVTLITLAGFVIAACGGGTPATAPSAAPSAAVATATPLAPIKVKVA